MSIFQKRHYEWLANELSLGRERLLEKGTYTGQLDDYIYNFSIRLEAENPAFNRVRFLYAIFKSEQVL